MIGTFTYHNPTKLYFGEDALDGLAAELAAFGPNVVLAYGGGSIKRNGVYDQVTRILRDAGKTVTEIAGVMPNPTVEKLREGVAIAREAQADLILAVGGGSVCDYAKAVSVSVNCDEDPWEKYYVRFDEPDCDIVPVGCVLSGGSVCDYAKAVSVSVNCDEDPWEKYYVRFDEPDCDIVPVGCVLTMAGTGSEMNAGAVITNPTEKMKVGHVFAGSKVMPRFSILNPAFTLSLPHEQVMAGVYDTFNHICEQYFSGDDDNVSDCISEGLMRSVVENGRIAAENDQDYQARSNIMWAATWALNTLISRGKSTDWMVHMLGQAAGAVTNATHGMTLSAVSLPYYRSILEAGLPKFVRFAENVWGIDPVGKTDRQIAEEGLAAMEAWIRELGLPLSLTEIGATESDLDDLVKATIILTGGYKAFTEEDVRNVLEQCF